MEQVPHSSGECRRAERCSLDQLSTVHAGAQTNHTHPFFYHTSSAHTVTQGMTSPMTRVSPCCKKQKSSNRKELTHFCCCLHRRRTLLKRWSRKHREAARPSTEKGDSSSTQFLHDYHHIRQTETSGRLRSHHNNPLLIDTSFYDIGRASSSFKDNRATFLTSNVNERRQCEMHCLSTDVLNINKLSRSKISSSNAVYIDSGSGAEIETPPSPPVAGWDAPIKPGDLKLHARLRPSIPRCTGETLGRLFLDFATGVFRIVPSTLQTLIRLAGGAREGGLGRRPCESRTFTGMNPAAQMTFHRWLIVLLVCIMVLPIHSTAAPGVPWQGSVVEEPGNEPGYKNSFYQELPPKAEYESVIICLLAVSAFIGLIVWVLKSNFEERQQKRMRREASIRERTSSVACLKT